MPETAERRALDREIELLTETEIAQLARYATFLRYSRAADAWADAPLTPEEEVALEQAKREFEAGDFYELEEFNRRMAALS